MLGATALIRVKFSHSMAADPQWAMSDWVSQDDEESVLEAILQQSAQEFYSKD